MRQLRREVFIVWAPFQRTETRELKPKSGPDRSRTEKTTN